MLPGYKFLALFEGDGRASEFVAKSVFLAKVMGRWLSGIYKP